MASMPFRASASRIVLAGLLLGPVAVIAHELGVASPTSAPAATAPVTASASAATFPVATMSARDAVTEWQALTREQRPSFDRVAAFLMANRGWPNEAELRRSAETALDINGYIPAYAADYFAVVAPTNAAGHLRQALALLSASRPQEATEAARRAWTSGTLSAEEESRLLTSFPGALSGADHDSRMDRLLWSGSNAAATRQITLVSPARQLEFSARLAMRTRATAAALRAAEAESANPALLSSDAGYIADKATWLAATGQTGAAQALLAGQRTLAVPPRDAERWLELIVAQARAAARAGDHRTAYDIARRVDDALPLGTDVLAQPLGVRDEYTNALWLAATTAHRQLGRPREAAGLYLLYSAGGRSPQVKARGLYWAGRAAVDAGDANLANDYFRRAATHFDQFHGQLALERLGEPQPRPTLSGNELSDAQRQAFDASSIVQAARLLGEQGQWREQTLFLRAIANNARSDVEHAHAALLSAEIGRPDLAVMIGRSARINGHDGMLSIAYPTMAVPEGHESNWTFIHAISRQESQFDRAAVSHAGARGLMQLMPGTARETAGQIGLSYNFDALTTDTRYNIMLGSTYFQRMLRYYGGSYPLAVAAYNAGPGNVNRWLCANGDPRTGGIAILDWIEAIPIFETRNYVHRVLENAVVYESLRPGVSEAPRNRLSYYLGKREPG